MRPSAEPREVVAGVERQLGQAGREMLGAVALVHEAEREVDEAHVARPWAIDVAEQTVLAFDAVARRVASQREPARWAESDAADLPRDTFDQEITISELGILDAAVAELGFPARWRAVARERSVAVAAQLAVDVREVRGRKEPEAEHGRAGRRSDEVTRSAREDDGQAARQEQAEPDALHQHQVFRGLRLTEREMPSAVQQQAGHDGGCGGKRAWRSAVAWCCGWCCGCGW
jgi:hypothetical protein